MHFLSPDLVCNCEESKTMPSLSMLETDAAIFRAEWMLDLLLTLYSTSRK